MSLVARRVRWGKRCFAYCGPERCDCGAGPLGAGGEPPPLDFVGYDRAVRMLEIASLLPDFPRDGDVVWLGRVEDGRLRGAALAVVRRGRPPSAWLVPEDGYEPLGWDPTHWSRDDPRPIAIRER